MLRRPVEPEEYTAGAFRAACERMGVVQSMGRPGSALDNAVIEAFHSTLTFELLHLESFATRAHARRRIVEWIEHYNHDRRHSALGMRSPVAFEQAAVAAGPVPGMPSAPPSSPPSRPRPAGGLRPALTPAAGDGEPPPPERGEGKEREAKIRLTDVSTVRGD